jgi:hypothetical protein
MRERLSTRLTPPALEAAFRQDALARDRRLARVLMLVAVAVHAASMPTDAALIDDQATLFVVWSVRATSALVGGVAFLLIGVRTSVRFFDRAVFVWIVLLLAGVVFANAMLPPTYTIHVAWDILLTLGVYTVAPLPMGRQVIAAGVMTVGDLSLFVWWKQIGDAGALSDVFLVFVCANAVGAFISWEMHRLRRRQFIALDRERLALADLRQAMDEVRTLRGIIPICASCKKIRTDAGDWRQVEAYVREHSHADFSHGICPTCATTIYGELADDP